MSRMMIRMGVQKKRSSHVIDCLCLERGLSCKCLQDGDEEAIQIENTFYEAQIRCNLLLTCLCLLAAEADDNKQNYPEQARDLQPDWCPRFYFETI